jgi:hypothetical protein
MRNGNNTTGLACRIGLAVALGAAAVLARHDAMAQTALPGSIHGNVAVILPVANSFASVAHAGQTGLAPGSRIYVSDIQVVARNVRTQAQSAPAVTNAEGYFRTPNLPAGQYQICVSAPGFAASCLDKTIDVFRPVVILDQTVPIRPAANAVVGTATLSDHRTPCFFFRPSFSPLALTAKASLLDGNGKLLAGPVNGNISGQYVLPVAAGDALSTLRVTCDQGIANAQVIPRMQVTQQDATIPSSTPRILAFDFSKAGAGIRRADPGDTVTVTVLADDPDNNPLHYSWADDSGNTLALPDSPTVRWPLLNANALNTLHVYVSNLKGGIATYSRALQSGPNENVFSGHVFNRVTNAGVAGAHVSVNGTAVTADASGNFRLSVPDAAKFVLNVTRTGYALASQVMANRVVGIQIPLDPARTGTVSGSAGGSISVGAGSGCDCACGANGGRDDEHFHILVEIPETRIDIRHGDGKDGGGGQCKVGAAGASGGGALSVTFVPGSFVSKAGTAYTGMVSVEAFQYDLSQPNPIPGDFGGVFGGKPMRLGSFGAFHLLPRDSTGQPLAMAPGKHASVSVPIQPGQLAVAPATIPLFHYDEPTGQWLEDGTLTRVGNAYVGEVAHFSVFNADTVFPGGACVKVLLSGFSMPVTLDAVYFDPAVGTFHHNGVATSDTTVGVERMIANQSFTLNITDAAATKLSVPLFSGPGLDPAQFPSGYDSDTVNFSHCNGPVQVGNSILPPTPPEFLGPVFGGSFVDNSANYQAATDALTGGSRDTLTHWKQANGFNTNGVLATGEAAATYFNNGDLKFGRDMHCRVTSSNVTACYVSNFGTVGTDDAALALGQADAYEASGQVAPLPPATVTMEYDPSNPASATQFWAYKTDGTYLAHPALDSQGPKPIPDICLACHQGSYSGTAGAKVNGAAFLPFDLQSFLDDTATPFPTSAEITPAAQQQFHLLNNIVANTSPPPGVTQLINLWYSSATPSVPFAFNVGAAQLPGQPFLVQPGNIHHEPLYDSVVAVVCRTCHVPQSGAEWNSYSQMSGEATFIQSLSCAPTVTMPHAEVPWKRFWQESLSATLASDLLFTGAGCPPS